MIGYTAPSGKKTYKQGKECKELLVHHCFVRIVDPAGDAVSAVLVTDPVPLTNGKGGESIFACTRSFMLNARDHGQYGIAIVHTCFDGAQHGLQARRMNQWHMVTAKDRDEQVR